MSSCYHFFCQFTTIPSCHPKEVCFSISSSPKRQMSTISKKNNLPPKMGCCLNQMIHHNLSPATSPFGPRNATLANVSVVFSFFENKPTNCQPNPRERMKTSWPSHLVLILFSVKGGPGRLVDQLGIHEYPGWFVKRFAMDILFGVPLPFSASKKVPRPATKMSILEQIRQIFRWE